MFWEVAFMLSCEADMFVLRRVEKMRVLVSLKKGFEGKKRVGLRGE